MPIPTARSSQGLPAGAWLCLGLGLVFALGGPEGAVPALHTQHALF